MPFELSMMRTSAASNLPTDAGTLRRPWWRSVLVHVAVIGSYALLALVHLRPLATRFTETLPRGERVDVLLHGWIVNWTARQLLRNPFELFDANIFFPHADTLAYTEHMVPEALPVAPLWALTRDPVLTYNVAYLLTFVLGGWGTFLLVRRLTGDPWAAWVAGAFACWFPAKRWSLAHINTISVHGVPFAMLALHRLLERPAAGRAVVAGLAVTFAALASAYYTVYLPLLLAVAVPLIWWAEHRPIDRRRLLAVSAAAVIAIATALPLLLPYLDAWTGGAGPARSYDLQVAGATDAAELFILDSVVWAPLLLPEEAALGPLTTPLFPGLVATLLLLAALFGATGTAVGKPGPFAGAGAKPARMPLAGAAVQKTGRGPLAGARRAVQLIGTLLALALVALLAVHLVAHHRATAALEPAPAAPWTALLVLAIAAAGLLFLAERRAFPSLPRRLWRRLRAAPRLTLAYAITAATALLLALGPQLKFFGYAGPPLPYTWVYAWMPGAAALRAPYRAAILGQAFVAVVIGFGAAALLARWRAPGRPVAIAAVLLTGLMTVETTGDPLPLHDVPQPDNPVYGWLAEQPGEFGILEWPIARLMDDTAPGQWLSTYHWKHRVTGHNGRLPEDIRELHPLARQWPPGPEFLDLLRERFPVRYVIVDLDRFERPVQRQLTETILPGLSAWWRFERAFDSKRVYRLRNGGEGATLRRRFAGWMPRGELLVRLTGPAAAGSRWRLGIDIDGTRLPATGIAPGADAVRIPLPDGLTGDEPVWVQVTVEGSGGPRPVIDQLSFVTREGIVYP